MRAVLDPNVVISALLSPAGTPVQLLGDWQQGRFELFVSPQLLAELERALGYPRLRGRIEPDEPAAIAGWLERSATLVPDPEEPPPVRSADPADDYLIGLAAAARAVLVSGDRHLLALAGTAPICSPRQLAELLANENE